MIIFVTVFALIPLIFIAGLLYNVLNPVLETVINSPLGQENQGMVTNFYSSLADLRDIFTVFMICYFMILFISCVIFSHKYFGPIIAFKRHSIALKDGSYSSRIRLRPGDEFGDLANELNQLAEHLQTKDS